MKKRTADGKSKRRYPRHRYPGERVALNYLQRMSGIATYTHTCGLSEAANQASGYKKTTPNMRIFEKYAVRTGGGYNHRYNLSDGALKDKPYRSSRKCDKSDTDGKKHMRQFVRKIEIEVETLDMSKEAVAAGADIIMLTI